MCTICGCGVTSDAEAHTHSHAVDHQHVDAPGHAHSHHHHAHAEDVIDFGSGPANVHVAGLTQGRTISIQQDILAKNNALAKVNRTRLGNAGVFALNLLSSPGSGKTTLLVRTITDLKNRRPISVIEGDQQTSRDAERIRATGVRAVQINTGKGCHLDAHMISHALDHLSLRAGGLLFVENVGNLVCPAAFDLGEARKVVVLSVTEGEDKPLKYPDMFAAADLMLLNKIDLLPHIEFDVDACVAAALRVNPSLEVLTISARSGDGLAAFYAWIETHASMMTSPIFQVT